MSTLKPSNENIIELEQDSDGVFRPSGKISKKNICKKSSKPQVKMKRQLLSKIRLYAGQEQQMTHPLDEFMEGINMGMDLLDRFFGKRR